MLCWVADEEDDARELLATVLQEAGALVTVASSVAEALAVLATTAISLIVSDVGMPIEDGYTPARRAARRREADIPALAFTAYARPEDRHTAMGAGFQEHAAKPIDPDFFVSTVAGLVAR